MNHDAYRPRGGPSPELARLAQQGQALTQAAHQGQDRRLHAEADRKMRVAIGALRGAPMKRVVLARGQGVDGRTLQESSPSTTPIRS